MVNLPPPPPRDSKIFGLFFQKNIVPLTLSGINWFLVSEKGTFQARSAYDLKAK